MFPFTTLNVGTVVSFLYKATLLAPTITLLIANKQYWTEKKMKKMIFTTIEVYRAVLVG